VSAGSLTNGDRWFFVQLYRWFPSILQVLQTIRPETLVRSQQTSVNCIFDTVDLAEV
jgi:hypothetical protein